MIFLRDPWFIYPPAVGHVLEFSFGTGFQFWGISNLTQCYLRLATAAMLCSKLQIWALTLVYFLCIFASFGQKTHIALCWYQKYKLIMPCGKNSIIVLQNRLIKIMA